MNILRRNVLKGAGRQRCERAVAAGLMKPTFAFAGWNKAGFEAKDIAGAMGSSARAVLRLLAYRRQGS